MRKFQEKRQYLCGIGNCQTKKIDNYEVGTYVGLQRFEFSNGSYSPTELNYKEKIGNNITCVLSVKSIYENNNRPDIRDGNKNVQEDKSHIKE